MKLKLLGSIFLSLLMIATIILIVSIPDKHDGTIENSDDLQQDESANSLNADNQLSINNGMASQDQLPVETFDKALIVFTFDDGNESDYELAFPILREYGINGTSYINPYNADHNVEHKLSWNQIKEMHSAGWDFEDHTYSHINLTESTSDQIEQSMKQVNDVFTANGLNIPVAIAYPYGKFDQKAIDIIKQYREQGRLAYYTAVFVDFSKLNLYEIPCVSADMRTEKRLKEKEKLVDKACFEGGIIVFRVHCLYKEEVDDMGKEVVQTSSKLFKKLVEYCFKNGCTFTTMDKLIKMFDTP